ncbi:MAG: hypothetical protein ACRDYC_05770, partial [Acidimicrobiales bacterium]
WLNDRQKWLADLDEFVAIEIFERCESFVNVTDDIEAIHRMMTVELVDYFADRLRSTAEMTVETWARSRRWT